MKVKTKSYQQEKDEAFKPVNPHGGPYDPGRIYHNRSGAIYQADKNGNLVRVTLKEDGKVEHTGRKRIKAYGHNERLKQLSVSGTVQMARKRFKKLGPEGVRILILDYVIKEKQNDHQEDTQQE